jgi:hypothetical protein
MKQTMKQTPFLDCYKKMMETGMIPESTYGNSFGLCYFFFHDPEFDHLQHKIEKFLDIIRPQPGRDPEAEFDYWGSETASNGDYEANKLGVFTPRRQTLTLLMAALNGEL